MNLKLVQLPGLVLAAALGCIAAVPAHAQVPGYAPTLPEGLKLVPAKNLDALYLRPGVDFSVYDKFALLECYVAFQKNWQLDQNNAQSFRVTDSDVIRIKKQLAQQFQNVFVSVLTAKGEKYVTAVGKGVLIIRPSIVNLNIAAPDTMNSGTNNLSLDAGQGTLVLELFDSVTSQLLARIIDTEVAGASSFMISRSGLSNREDAKKVLTNWADRLATALQKARAGAKAPT